MTSSEDGIEEKIHKMEENIIQEWKNSIAYYYSLSNEDRVAFEEYIVKQTSADLRDRLSRSEIGQIPGSREEQVDADTIIAFYDDGRPPKFLKNRLGYTSISQFFNGMDG